MPSLHVRNVPDTLYERLKNRARQQDRSLSAEVIVLLDSALADAEHDQQEILDKIRRRRSFAPAEAGAAGSTALLREDRGR